MQSRKYSAQSCRRNEGEANGGDSVLLPVLNAYNPSGSTQHVDFTTSKQTILATRPDKCHLNYVVYDRDREAGFAERIEGMSEVISYVKNHSLNFEVPYDYKGSTRKYRPDYIVRVANGDGEPAQSRGRDQGRARRFRRRQGRHDAQGVGTGGQCVAAVWAMGFHGIYRRAV